MIPYTCNDFEFSGYDFLVQTLSEKQDMAVVTSFAEYATAILSHHILAVHFQVDGVGSISLTVGLSALWPYNYTRTLPCCEVLRV